MKTDLDSTNNFIANPDPTNLYDGLSLKEFLIEEAMNNKMKIHKINYISNKSNRIKEIINIIEKGNYKTIIDVFGGSLCVSVNVKAYFGDRIKVIANDYDDIFIKHGPDYKSFYEEFIIVKQNLIKTINEKGLVKQHSTKLSDDHLKILQNEISKIDKKFWKYLGTNFVFSGKLTRNLVLEDFIYYRGHVYDGQYDEYLSIIDKIDSIEMMDCFDLMTKYKDEPDCLFILDPPYLNSAQKFYGEDRFFGLSKTIKMLRLINSMYGSYFMWFNQVERDTIDLIELFDNLQIKEVLTKISSIGEGKRSTREDCLFLIENILKKEFKDV